MSLQRAILSVLASVRGAGLMPFDEVQRAIVRSIGRLDDEGQPITVEAIESCAWTMALGGLVTMRSGEGGGVAITDKGTAEVAGDQDARFQKAAVEHDLAETAAKWRTMRDLLAEVRDTDPRDLPPMVARIREAWIEAGCPGLDAERDG